MKFATLNNFNIVACKNIMIFTSDKNSANRSEGIRYFIEKENEASIYSSYAAHSLSLVGVNAAECCSDSFMYFGNVEKIMSVLFIVCLKLLGVAEPMQFDCLDKNFHLV